MTLQKRLQLNAGNESSAGCLCWLHRSGTGGHNLSKPQQSAANKARKYSIGWLLKKQEWNVVEDKVIKNHFASEYIFHTYEHTKPAM